jgi:hypothetical protein
MPPRRTPSHEPMPMSVAEAHRRAAAEERDEVAPRSRRGRGRQGVTPGMTTLGVPTGFTSGWPLTFYG